MVFITPDSLQESLAQTCKTRRIALQMTQREVAERAQVSLSVVRKFEQTSQISWASLTRLLFVLDLASPILEGLDKFMHAVPDSMDELLALKAKKPRQRAYSPRKKRNR